MQSPSNWASGPTGQHLLRSPLSRQAPAEVTTAQLPPLDSWILPSPPQSEALLSLCLACSPSIKTLTLP